MKEQRATMADRIRFRVWVLALAPILLVGAGAAFVLSPGAAPRLPPVATNPSIPPDPEPVLPPSPAVAPVASPVFASAAPALQAPPPPTLSVDPYGSVSGPPPEPIPELEPAALRPPGSQSWSPEQKTAYRQRMFEQMDARDRSLQQEIAAAQRAGDTATAQRKQLTLSYLRHKRADIERLLGKSPPPAPDPVDSGI